MSRRKKNQDEKLDESWLIPYADMLTLLLALFIVLFATSSLDAAKFEKMASVFQQAFSGGYGIMQYQAPVDVEEQSANEENEHDSQEQDQGNGDEDQQQPEQEHAKSAEELDEEELRALKDKIDLYIRENQLQEELETQLSQDGLLLLIMDDALFDSGSAQVRPNARTMAEEIANLLVLDPPRSITIGGHTDNVPIQTDQFPSNWELSSARAINFMKILLANADLDPYRISATGYGEYRPVDTNDTPEGRAKNRRVEVLILPRVQMSE